MKAKFLFFLILSFNSMVTLAQNKNIPPVDKSPMDMSYYPANYPILKIQDKVTEPLYMRLIYSRPQKNSREVFGGLVEYGQIWRLGANEAVEIEFFRDAKIGSSKVKKGRYTLYAIPNQDKWTMILNRDTDTWGAFKYDQKKDILRYDIRPEKQPDSVESYSMYFEKAGTGVNLVIAWDNIKAALPIGF
jgi:Protein of unknown function (DUF2911)